jgi:hypothetical protein
MKPPSKETLRRITEEFPTLPWADREIEELVAPRFGIITGFAELLDEIEALGRRDLGAAGPAAALRAPREDP